MSTTTRVTPSQYEQMIDQGAFEPCEDHKVELIRGEIVPLSPINPPHYRVVNELTEWSFESLPARAMRIAVQGPIGIPELESMPEPDLVWLRRADYGVVRPKPADVLLLVEVSDSSLAKDRGVKARLYAEAGIQDFWIVNIRDSAVEVHRDPAGLAYRDIRVYQIGEDVRPLAFPGAALPVGRLFGD